MTQALPGTPRLTAAALAGDVAVFPRGWRGTWQIHEKTRHVADPREDPQASRALLTLR